MTDLTPVLDLVIRGGDIVDGSGSEPFRGDVGIKDGLIVAVGKISAKAHRTLDATGALVTPGFVDIHTHYDGQATWDGVLAPSSINGVTSIAMGNCGVGFAPARKDKHDWLIALLEGVEDIPGTALAEGLSWDWESFPDYLDALDRRQFAVDIGAHVPHAALRAYVMGDRGGDHLEVPTTGEIAEMERLIFEAVQAGALGFSTSRTYVHRSRSGETIGTLSATEAELMAAARALKAAGRGVIQLISDAYLTPDDDFAERELGLIRTLAGACGGKLSFTVQQTDDAPDRWKFISERVEAMVKDGLPVSMQVAPRPLGLILSFAATVNPFFITPTYRGLLNLPLEARLLKLAEPEVRAQILKEHANGDAPGMTAVILRGFGKMFRMTDPVDYEPRSENSLEAEAMARGIDAAAYVYDTLLEEGGHRLIYQPLINYSRGDLSDVYGMMTAPNSLYGLSDGGAHCGTICDGSFPTTSLALWSKGDRSGRKIAIEALIHGYTRRNAQHVGWHDRGLIAPGMLADINIIDHEALSLSPPEIVQDLPAGGTRLLQKAHGYRWTLKSGIVTFENGQWTGELPGRLLRGDQVAALGTSGVSN
jgi:N-acyl-D-aspartate/D-glutamate deacylase